MDYKRTARIKINSRLKPAKDIHVAFSNLLSCTDPNNFEDLKRKFILSIDSAEIELKILQDEVSTMENLISKWNNEIEECSQQLGILKEKEYEALTDEKDAIDQEREQIDQLSQMKAKIKSEKIYAKIDSTNKIQEENRLKTLEIEKVKETNELRKDGLNKIVEGFQKFLLIEKPPNSENENKFVEEDFNQDEEKYNEENSENND